MDRVKSLIAIVAISLALAALVACSQQTAPQPGAPDPPIPAPTAAAPPVVEMPTQGPATAAPSPIRQPPPRPPTLVVINSPIPTPTQVAFVMPPPEPTETPAGVPTPEPTATEIVVAQVIPTSTEVPSVVPTEEPTAVPTMAPTATQVPPTPVPPAPTTEPTPTQEPQDTSPPYVIVVDFYSGNTFNNPGPENCNPERCGGALVQFSEPVLMYGHFIMDVRGKGVMRCYEGCSYETPSPYAIFSGDAWVEPDDQIIDGEILRDGIATITDAAGNEIESYVLGAEIKARVSDFAMVQGPTPEPTPVPSSVSNQFPYVIDVYYKDTVVEVHLNEPVVVIADSISNVSVNVRLEDGTVVRGECIDPCEGNAAVLSFDVLELDPTSIATSLSLTNGATIRDSEGLNIDPDFEALTLDQVVTIEKIEIIPLDFPGMNHPYWTVNFYLTDEVWIDGTDMKLRTASGLEIPCYECVYGPNGRGNFIEFGWPIDDLSIIPKVPDDDSILEIVVVDGNLVSVKGILADVRFDQMSFKR